MRKLPFLLFFLSMLLSVNTYAWQSNELRADSPPQVRAGAGESVFELITSRIQADFEGRRSAEGYANLAKEHLALYQDTIDVKTGKDIHGKFTDIPYTSKQRASWPVRVHLIYLQDMAFAYTMSGSEYYQDEALYEKIVRGLQLWYDRNPICPNWFANEIGAPIPLGVTLLQMRKGKIQVPAELEKNLIWRTLSREAWTGDWQSKAERQAGPNKTNIALVYLYRACLNNDSALMTRALTQAFDPIKLVTSEGIQHDYSYFQHGQQFQLGAYGQDLIGTTDSFIKYVVGTEFTMSGNRLNIYSKYLREAYYRVIRGQHIQFNAIGRAISRAGGVNRSGTGYAATMTEADPTHYNEYVDIISRIKGDKPVGYNVKSNNTTFFVGDYVVHNRPTFQVGVRMASTRTVRSEWGNGEALQTYFMSDGSTGFLQKGDEYRNIAVGWNWTRIPGTTAPQFAFDKIPKTKNGMYAPGYSTFAGGVSDSLYSANVYVNNDNYSGVNTKYNKSWFFFDNEVVFLGAGITSTSTLEINTAVEQNLLKSDIVISTANGESTIYQSSRGELPHDNLKWAMHNGAGYFFPNGGQLKTANTTTTRAWKALNTAQSGVPVATDVFSLWFNHGLKPQNKEYAYIIVPNMNSAQDMKNYKIDDIEILANTDSVQVVRHKGLNIWQMVFTKAATFEHEDITIKTNKGIALILKNVGTPEVVMHVADPAQLKSPIVVASLIPTISPDVKQTVCDFTGTGRYAGATKVFTINANSDVYVPPAIIPELEPDFVYESLPLADTYVADFTSGKGSNYGSQSILVTKKESAGKNRDAYIKFSLDDLDKIDNMDDYNLEVSVVLYPVETIGGGATKWQLRPVIDTVWDEFLVTWNKKPTGISTSAITSISGFGIDPEDAITYNPQKVAKFNIATYALAEYGAENKIISLSLQNPTAAGIQTSFASKEHENELMRPKLVIKGYNKNIKLQAITFATIPAKNVGDEDFELNATASSGLDITFTSSDEDVAIIVDGKVQIVSVGKTMITASQAGNAEYKAAEDVSRELTVNEKEPGAKSDFVYELLPLADTYVADYASGKDSNFGSQSIFISKKESIGKDRHTYIKFSLENLDKVNLEDYNIEVSVALYPVETIGGGATKWQLLPVKDVLWDEFKVTWNKRPTGIGTSVITSISGYAVKTGAVSSYDSSNVAKFNIATYALTEYLAGNKIISLSLQNTTAAGVQTSFASKEHENVQMRPKILIKGTVKELQPQTITFASISDKQIGDESFNLDAMSSSGLDVTFTSSDQSVATIIDGKVNVVGVGKATIIASQAGNAIYKAAEDVSQELTVTKQDQSISFEALPAKKTGDEDFDLVATATSELAVVYTSSDKNVAIIIDGKVHIVGVGTTGITASQAGNDMYNAAPAVTQQLVVVSRGYEVSTFAEFERAMKTESITEVSVTKGFRFERNVTEVPNRDVIITGSKDAIIDSHIWSIYGKQNTKSRNTLSIIDVNIVADQTVGRFFTGGSGNGPSSYGWDVYSDGVNYSGARFVHLSEGTLTFSGNNTINTRCENAWVHNLIFKVGSVYKGTAASGGQFAAFYFNGALINGKVTGNVALENGADVSLTISPNNDNYYYYPAFYDKVYNVNIDTNASLKVDAAGVAFQFIPRANYVEAPSLNIADGAVVELNGRGGGNYAAVKLQQYNTAINVNKGGTLNISGYSKYGVVESVYKNTAFKMNDGKELVIENKLANSPLFKSSQTQFNLAGVSEIEIWGQTGGNYSIIPVNTLSGFSTLNTVIDGKMNGKVYSDESSAIQGFQLGNYGKIIVQGGSKMLRSLLNVDGLGSEKPILKCSSHAGMLTVSCDRIIDSWEIYSMNQIVAKARVNSTSISTHLSSGVYIINAIVEGQSVQAKVIVK